MNIIMNKNLILHGIIIFTITIFVFILGFTLIDNSYGQRGIAPREDPSLPEVSLQLQLRNSEGQLVTYIEPTTMYILNLYLVHEFLDTKNKTIIEKNGEMFELIQYDQKAFFSKTKQIASYGMVYKDFYVIIFRHDAYLTSPGDTLYVSWKIIRTIP